MFSLLPTSFVRGATGDKRLPHPVFPTFNRYISQEKGRVAHCALVGAPDGMASIDPSHPHHKRINTKLKRPCLELGIITKQNLQEELMERAKKIDDKLNKLVEITEQTRIHAQEVLMQLCINNKCSGDLRGKNVNSSS